MSESDMKTNVNGKINDIHKKVNKIDNSTKAIKARVNLCMIFMFICMIIMLFLNCKLYYYNTTHIEKQECINATFADLEIMDCTECVSELQQLKAAQTKRNKTKQEIVQNLLGSALSLILLTSPSMSIQINEMNKKFDAAEWRWINGDQDSIPPE